MKVFSGLKGDEKLYCKEELKILEEEILFAKSFLKQKGGSKNLFLVLGFSGFGKSTLLSKADIGLKDQDLVPINSRVGSTKGCVFWYTEEGVFIDTAGVYTEGEDEALYNQALWVGFIQLLQKHFGATAIKSLLLVFDLPKMIENEEAIKAIIASYKQRIYETQNCTGKLKYYVILSKCDRISGFKSFFELLKDSELEQPLGFLFSPPYQNLLLDFKDKFDALEKNLKKLAIKDIENEVFVREVRTFLLEFHGLERFLTMIICGLPVGRELELSGVFFTSSCQRDTTIYPETEGFLEQLGLTIKPGKNQINKQRSYFIKPMFRLILRQNKHPEKRGSNQHKLFFILGGIFLILVMGFGYVQSLRRLELAKLILKTDEVSIERIEEQRNRLATEAPFGALSRILGFDYLNKIDHYLEKKKLEVGADDYQRKVETLLRTQIKQGEGDKVFKTLEVYLTFKNAPYKLKNFRSWLKENLEVNWRYPVVFNSNPLNEALVLEGQRYLIENYPLHLLNKKGLKKKKIFLGKRVVEVPEAFLKQNFDKIYHSGIKKEMLFLPRLTTQKLEDLVYEAKKAYIAAYNKFWQAQWVTVLNLDDFNCKNLQKIMELKVKEKPLAFLVDNLPDLEGFSELRQQFKEENWQQFQKEVGKFFTFYQAIEDSEKTLIWLKDYFRYEGKNWREFSQKIVKVPGFETLLVEMEQILLREIEKKVAEEMRNAWNVKVLPEYRRLIEGFYPFNKTSQQDLPVENLVNFFGPGKILEGFFKEYVRSFVITEDNLNWNWRAFEGKPLAFGNYLLEKSLRGALIQKMFYAIASPGFNFALANLKGDNKEAVSLFVGEKKVNFTDVPEFNWPKKNEVITLTYSANDGKIKKVISQGIWNWFRLLDQLEVKHLKGGKFEIILGREQFYLITKSLNPFIPEVLTEFNCTLLPK